MPKHESPIQAALDQALWLTSNLPIRLFGDPVLMNPCEPVTDDEIRSGQAQKWADELIEFLNQYRKQTGGGRGLAANQIGIPKQVILIWLDSGPEIYINPEVVSQEGEGVYPESCISSAALLLGDVVRPWTAIISFITLTGAHKTIEPDHMLTRVLLHELDHLEGKVCSDRYAPGTIRLTTGDKGELTRQELKRIN